MGRRKSKLTKMQIEGTSLKLNITSNMATRIKKGTAKLDTIAKQIAYDNPLALQGLFRDPEVEFKRLAKLSTTPQNFMQRVTTAYRSALYSVDKGRLLAENMKLIVQQTLSDGDVDKLKKDTGMKNLTFDDWTWNEGLKRLESPDGKYWVNIEGSAEDGDYQSVDVKWGNI